MNRLRVITVISVVLILVGVWGFSTLRSFAPLREAQPTPARLISPEDDITKYSHFNAPGLDQAQIGESIYENWCEACHADTGLGLTADWRAQWDPEHQNCWQAKCHSLDHPSDGFVIPRYVPAVVGVATLGSFESAADLQAYLKAQMPYAERGVLDDPMYWALTAYLLNRNDITTHPTQLGPDNAALVHLER